MNAYPFYKIFCFDQINFLAKISAIDNVQIGQTLNFFKEMKKIIKQFDTIIEIGYDKGGLTLWLHYNKKEEANLFAYDITDSNRQVFNKTINFIEKNCFNKECIQEISEIIKNGKRTLVFCDGGNKNKEFNLFSSFLKPNDVIMLHDFFDDTQAEPYNSFEDSQGWIFGYESNYLGIQESLALNNLKKYNYENFRKVLVGSFLKTK